MSGKQISILGILVLPLVKALSSINIDYFAIQYLYRIIGSIFSMTIRYYTLLFCRTIRLLSQAIIHYFQGHAIFIIVQCNKTLSQAYYFIQQYHQIIIIDHKTSTQSSTFKRAISHYQRPQDIIIVIILKRAIGYHHSHNIQKGHWISPQS